MAGLSLARRHQDMHAARLTPPSTFSATSSTCFLAMVNENFAGRNQITLVMKAPADSLVLYQLKLQIDSISVNGVQRGYTTDDANERFTVISVPSTSRGTRSG